MTFDFDYCFVVLKVNTVDAELWLRYDMPMEKLSTQQKFLLSHPLVIQAREYAKAAHESIDQRRNHTNLPYITHPIAVARIVAGTSMAQGVHGPEAVAAAMLHDVIEDVVRHKDRPEADRERMMLEIKSRFPFLVVKHVLEVTNVATHADGNRATRCQINKQHIIEASPLGATIKYADINHNVHDILEHDPQFALTYLPEKADVVFSAAQGDHDLRMQTVALLIKSMESLIPTAGSKFVGRLKQSVRNLQSIRS